MVEQLTAAYVDIASARLRLRGQPEQVLSELNDLLSRMRRLADTYESYTALGLFPEQTRSAAFVAGAARQVTARIIELRARDERPARLDEDAIGGDIAAALLFLIAEQPSDALEAAKAIRTTGGEMAPVRRALIIAVRSFCQGAFGRVVGIDPEREGLGADDIHGRAANLMFRELLRGVRLLAQVGLGDVGDEAIADAEARFARVRHLAVDAPKMMERSDGSSVDTVSMYAGPHHLAALLGRASKTLASAALVRTPTPGGADETTWQAWLKAEAGRWPFLWSNHRSCLQTGYLNKGQSLVMTTPTGSGKTTLATLKIAATLASGESVLYLAPTHALVSQVERDLNARISGIARAGSIEDITLDDVIEALPDLAVATPERCLALLTFAPRLFANVGLLVFDEFHLLGVSRPATETPPQRIGRRGIDAMLCLLTFLTVRKEADVLLLSAMVSNGSQVASWLESLLRRPVQTFDDRWKPTRQLRACVTYDSDELARLRSSISSPMASGSTTPNLDAKPVGLFSLVSGWNPRAPDKLALRPLSAQPIPLRKGTGPWLTSNRGVVAARLAQGFADAGLKVIVFCENIRTCVSVASVLNTGPGGKVDQPLSGSQVALRDSIIEELGVKAAIYDAGSHRAAVHHGELLRGERELVEGLFRDSGSGVSVLAATSTLAQGLNLPCEVVILAGTDRLGEEEGEAREPLMAYEILNALGRAGRAGQASTGLAIVIPAIPLSCRPSDKALSDDAEVKIVFSDSDQCLPLEDPLAALFDQIEEKGVAGEEAQYLLRRLSVSFGEGRVGVEGFDSLGGRTFGFWRRSQQNLEGAKLWLSQRRATLEAQFTEITPMPQLPWQEELAARTGANASFIAALAGAYSSAPLNATEANDWIAWLLDQLDPESPIFDVFLRPESLGRVFGRSYDALIAAPGGRTTIRDGLKLVLVAWLSGKNLTHMEAEICAFVAAHEGVVKRPTKADSRAQRARRFALRLAPDLGFLCGVLVQVADRLAEEPGAPPTRPMVTFLPNLIRHGCRTPYHYLIRRSMETPSRPAVELRFESIAAYLDRQPTDDWTQVRTKVEQAFALEAFREVSKDLEELKTFVAGGSTAANE
ncbi:DEAD/DEAH box helicase [Roseococcus sp. SYP-B2431]|uniref:DEAD/DEAH box helicase n=1 Tax=Roseococcus sp. SYP-B2431 TaxID=2496640 RepID=UPI001039EBA4|nr:DEAD/DEAH box helicase [Roseococcus sp. SYP-B2431]TCI00689.1 DEAD/DEAH box helicase [Roseococcus sp. SYP-B2431]